MLTTCDKCGRTNVQCYQTFGKLKCKECIQSSPKRGSGHSGMIYHSNVQVTDYAIASSGLVLVSVPKSHPLFVKWFIEHYPKSKGIVGRQLNYLIYLDGMPIGIIGGASPPLHFKKFEEFFGANVSEMQYLNNNVFRIGEHTDRNLGTKVLKLFRTRIKVDYIAKYGDTLVGLVTFVEPPRTGAVYRADNWVYLGETHGIHVVRRGSDWLTKTYKKGINKHIFAKKL